MSVAPGRQTGSPWPRRPGLTNPRIRPNFWHHRATPPKTKILSP